MKVAIFDLGIASNPPSITHRGEWDEKRVSEDYARVTGQEFPVHIAYLIKEEHADMVLNEIVNAWKAKKAAEDAFMATVYSMRNQFGVR